jgi:hypothetical protein
MKRGPLWRFSSSGESEEHLRCLPIYALCKPGIGSSNLARTGFQYRLEVRRSTTGAALVGFSSDIYTTSTDRAF